MRWIVAGLVTLCAAWGLYIVSPYYTLYRIGRAVETGDVAELEKRVNLRALRYSLARQVAAEVAASERGIGIASNEAQMAAAAALALADPVLDVYVRPDGLIRLLRTSPAGDPTGSVFGRRSIGVEDIDDFLGASTWRGFRNVYVWLPPGEARDRRYRLQLRLGNWRWRLVALDLPPSLVRRIAGDLISRARR